MVGGEGKTESIIEVSRLPQNVSVGPKSVFK